MMAIERGEYDNRADGPATGRSARIRARATAVLATAVLAAAMLAAAAPAAPLASQTSDEIAIGEIVDGLPAAWNAGDADAWIEHFTEHSTFTNILGMHFPNREANRARHASLFETVFEGSRLEAELLSLHRVGRVAAIAEVGLELRGYRGLPPGISETQRGVLKTRLILALQRIESRWWVIAAQNTAVLPPP